MSFDPVFQSARQLAGQGQTEAALALAAPLAYSHPTDPRVWNLIGSLQMQLGQAEQAVDSLRKSVNLDGKAGIPWINFGHALRRVKQFPQAIEAFQNGTQRSPLEVEGHVGLGEALLEASRFAESHAAFSYALGIMPERAQQQERAKVGQFGTDPFWWQPHRFGPVELRPMTLEDVPYFVESCADRAFMDLFNAPQSAKANAAELVRSISEESLLAPAQRGNIKWIAWHKAQQQRIGMVGFPNINLLHGRAEGAGGVRHPWAERGLGVAAWLAGLDFAFGRLGVHKVVAYVYDSNPMGLKQLLNIGFTEEGFLCDHIRLQSGRWLGLHSLALFRTDWESNPRLVRLKHYFKKSETFRVM
jgi:RimJ/RimL family protein N-acetyltransferase